MTLGGFVQKWNGSSWEWQTVKRWNGSTWEDRPLYLYQSGAWNPTYSTESTPPPPYDYLVTNDTELTNVLSLGAGTLSGKTIAMSGSLFTGTQPRGYVKGNAAALSVGGGINLGSSAQKWVLTGTITDV